MADKNKPIITRNFIKNLSRGAAKSVLGAGTAEREGEFVTHRPWPVPRGKDGPRNLEGPK